VDTESFPELGKAARVANEVVMPHADRWDRECLWPEPALRALQREGLGGLVIPARFGGLGRGLLELMQVCEALGRADGSTALCFGMHCVATACISANATPEQADRLLAPIAAGRHLTTLALSEPGTGSHFYLPQAKMTSIEGGGAYRLDGTKCFVTNGGHADSYVISAVADDEEAPPGHFSLLLVEAESPGLQWGENWLGWGMRGNSSRSVVLRDVRCDARNRLGQEGDQIWYVFSVVAPYFLVAMAGAYLGIAGRAVDEVRAHLKRRHYTHTGGALSEIGVLQHRLGTLWACVERTKRLCYWAASAGDRADRDALPALCAAKAEVARAAVHVTNECMTLSGGSTYRDGTLLQRLLRDARAADVMSPTTDLLYGWLGRALLDLPLLGE
jgi:alkylation response protein AidB-like acyl-CoA dehydrogenase